MKRWFAAIALCIGLVLPANAAYRITNDYGGQLTHYVDMYTMLSAAEGKVEFDGICASGCTLALGFLKAENVCVMHGSKWGFHTASQGEEFSSDGTNFAWAMYPEWVRTLLADHGMDGKSAHPDLVWFPGTTFYKRCA